MRLIEIFLQRSFKLETFHDTAARMENTLGRTMQDVEKFRNLGEKANKIVIEKIRQDEEWENVPTEFECAIMGEMMDDPVILPSGGLIMISGYIQFNCGI